MFKRILKVIGITLGIFIVVAGLGFGIYAIGGGFKNEEIVIQALYFGNESEVSKIDYTLDDVTVTINCTPKDATDKKLELSIIDDVGVLDNPPTSVVAGQPFKLKIKKDADGNNIGGVVNITATKGTGFVKYTLISDVAIPNDVVYFGSGENSTNHPIDGITMALSPDEERHIYLNSSLVNAFYLDAGKDGKVNNLKEIEIGYDYYVLTTDQDGNKIKEKDTGLSKVFEKDALIPTKSEITNKYYFEIPIVPKRSGTIELYAKMHRTKEIQDVYVGNGFKIFETATSQTAEVANLFDEYSDFFNAYTKYFDIDENDYKDLINIVTMQPDGTVYFNNLASVKKSLDYVYVKSTISIEVVDADIESISSELNVTPKVEYDVNESVTYDLKQLITEYSLNAHIKSAQTSFYSSDYGYFRDLVVTPVLYLSKGDIAGDDVAGSGAATDNSGNYDASIWGQFDTYGVYKTINVNNQIMSNFEPEQVTNKNQKQRFKKITDEKVIPSADDEYAGYLIKLNKTVANRSNYFTITKNEEYDENGIPAWKFTFNVPKTSVVGDCLYVMFEMTSENPSTGVKNYSYTFTPISITYNEASQSEVMSFDGFDNNNHSKMTITSDLNDDSYSTKQYLSIKGNATTTATYKDIMYFVEQSSNNPDTTADEGAGVSAEGDNLDKINKKVVSVGTYQFRWLDDTIQTFGDASDILFGERIPTYDSSKKQFYIDPINVTNGADVKIFAVRYLTDASGNPIDKYGRVIDFSKETKSSADTPIELVILDFTQIMATCSIDAFAERINFYTDSAVSDKKWTLEDGSELLFTGKRNNFDGNYSVDAEKFLSMQKTINDDLSLKLLYDMEFTLYVSNIDLSVSKGSITQNTQVTEYQPKNLVYPNGDTYGEGLVFDCNNPENDMNAFMKLIGTTSGNTGDYALDYVSTDFYVTRVKSTTDTIEPYITFIIKPKAEAINTSSSFAMKAENGVVAITNLNASYNKVSYVVNQLEITGTSLNVDNYNNTVDVKYASKNGASASDTNTTNVHTSPNGELVFDSTFNKGKDYILDSITDANNLIDSEGNIDRQVVDMSIDLGEEGKGLQAYIENITKTRSSAIYVPDTVYKLTEDLEFVAIATEDGKYKIEIAGDSINVEGEYFELCGMLLTIASDNQGGHCVKIPAGTLLPAVEKEGKSYVYLLDYLFEIKDPNNNPYIMSDNNNGSSAGVTADFYFVNSLGQQITYKNTNYFSVTTDPINTDGTVDFTYGEEFVDSIYTGAPTFVLVQSTYTYTYTIDGVPVSMTEVFYNAIQFELKQEDIELFAKDATNDGLDYIYDTLPAEEDDNINYYRFNDYNSNSYTNQLTINLKSIADKNSVGNKTINAITDINDSQFVKYIEFSLSDYTVEQFKINGNNNYGPVFIDESYTLNIIAPKSINDVYATLQIKYKNKYHMSDEDQPEYIYKYIRLQVGGPTLEFTSNLSPLNGNYELSIDGGQSITDWSNYFEIPDGYQLKLVKEAGSTSSVDVNGKTLTTKVVYANMNSGLDTSRYSMQLVSDTLPTLQVEEKLIVSVNPTYYVEVITGIDNLRFTAGDSIFGNVIKMYNKDKQFIPYDENKAIYDTLTVSLKIEDSNIFDVDNNVIAYQGMNDITNAVLSIALDTQNTNYYTPSTGGINGSYSNIKINGIRIKFDENGDISSNETTAEVINTNATRTIQLVANVDDTINISNYFTANLKNHSVAIEVGNKYINGSVSLTSDIEAGISYAIVIINTNNDKVVAKFDNITLKIIQSQVTIMFDEDGDDSYYSPSVLNLGESNVIEITPIDDKVDLTEYFTSISSTTNENIAVGIKLSNDATTGVGGVISISGDIKPNQEYTLCVYYVGSNIIAREYSDIKIKFKTTE